MNSSNKQIDINVLVKQYQEFILSKKEITEMLFTKETKTEWKENYHLIDSNFIKDWKDIICFDLLEKEHFDIEKDKEPIFKFIKKNMKGKNSIELNNESIYYPIENNYLIDPMKSFLIITDQAWKAFDIKKENIKYNGKVSLLKGNKKIIIKFDENNYSVKYLNKNLLSEFIIKFDPPQNDKKTILEDVLKNNISNWMKNVGFNYTEQQFTINKYKIPFDIKQKYIDNYLLNMSLDLSDNDNIINLSDKSSLSIFNFSESIVSNISNNISSFINPEDDISSIHSNDFSNFLNSLNTLDISNFLLIDINRRYIQKYNETTNACAVMRCLSRILSLTKYFINNNIKENTVFAKFPSNKFINLIKDFFINLYNDEKTPYAPKEFTKKLQTKKIINIYQEQDPIIFLTYIIDYINTTLNNCDKELHFNFNNLKIKEPYNKDLNDIINKNNSIISKNILGLMLVKYECHCTYKFKKIIDFKIIDIDYISIIKDFENKGDSMIQKTIDDLLEYYFLQKNIGNSVQYEKCPKCGKNAKIVKKEILHYPSYLIVRLNFGEFKEKEGFIKKDDIQYYYIKYDKIKILKDYCSNKSAQYNDIQNSKYYLNCMIHYTKLQEKENENETKIKFLSICKAYGSKKWISFICNSTPRILNNYNNNIVQPYILFYKLGDK